MTSTSLHWLPKSQHWRHELKELRGLEPNSPKAWSRLVALANTQLDFTGVNALASICKALFPAAPPPDLSTKPVRLAILSSCTVSHLLPSIQVAGLRHGLWIETYECAYGQYRQELLDTRSDLHAFKPTAILFSLDATHLGSGVNVGLSDPEVTELLTARLDDLKGLWALCKTHFACEVIQQMPLNTFPFLIGGNEHLLSGSRRTFIRNLAAGIRQIANPAEIDTLNLDEQAEVHGLHAWFDVGLWNRSKQEVTLSAAPLYGDLVARILAAKQGRSYKCLILDLDNTLWGGVIGDDGLDGIAIGQGSALGEAFVDLQVYALELARRGVILAVCSKNDEANAVEPFVSHPDMILKRNHIASFMANWNDKPSNIQAIAHSLSIGLDSMVFVDDNPFERNLVREALPMVAVPEIPVDPAWVPACLSSAGYFESLRITEEDRSRGAKYQDNIAREILRANSTDLPTYLKGLAMELIWSEFDATGMPRIVQLINKTNQFNLTTRRYTEEDVKAMMEHRNSIGLQFRLVDRFGDNGMIAVVISRPSAEDASAHHIDSWLMSCRVLGRDVEAATLQVLASVAGDRGVRALIGEYRPTKKNAMVREHYAKLGFKPIDVAGEPTGTFSRLELPAKDLGTHYINIIRSES